ncbi:exodeoxyribonuclease VII small subunit [Ruania alba]|uniref:Pyroglutamyl-peptidase I n=1 Tax=Ruania alba TaxID=648782 RepID=A0A1H5GIJ4_9MICO|nr:exodeoxyribonuclease VII small subunit [Ruania alba]SEE15345.1 pyroglutamyl-peptidase [Ruania alba]
MAEPATVLLTGFEPFDGARTNPSIDAVRLVAEQWRRPERLVTAQLPVSYERAAERLERLLAEYEPTLVVATGLAAARPGISLERLAVNLCDAPIPDNDGAQPAEVAVVDGGPTGLWTSLPVKRALVALHAADIPAVLSMTAGTYVCNAVFYRASAWAETEPGRRRAGFVHVPATEQLDLASIARALHVVLEEALDPRPDLTATSGSVS